MRAAKDAKMSGQDSQAPQAPAAKRGDGPVQEKGCIALLDTFCVQMPKRTGTLCIQHFRWSHFTLASCM